MLKRLLIPIALLGPSVAFARPDQGPIALRTPGKSERLARPNVTVPNPGRPSAEVCGGLGEIDHRSGPLPFRPGEELAYELSFAGAYIGRFETKVGKPRVNDGQTYLPLFGRARTSAFVAAFKTFEGRYQSMADAQTLSPSFARVEASFGDEKRWEKIGFTAKNRAVRDDFLFKGEVKARSYESTHDLTDVLTMLYQARLIAIRPGLEACQDVFGNRWLWRMKARLVGEAQVDTPGGTKPAWKIAARFERAPHPEAPQVKAQTIDLDIYLAQDKTQTPLKFVARTLGIEAEGNLVRWSLNGSTSESEW